MYVLRGKFVPSLSSAMLLALVSQFAANTCEATNYILSLPILNQPVQSTVGNIQGTTTVHQAVPLLVTPLPTGAVTAYTSMCTPITISIGATANSTSQTSTDNSTWPKPMVTLPLALGTTSGAPLFADSSCTVDFTNPVMQWNTTFLTVYYEQPAIPYGGAEQIVVIRATPDPSVSAYFKPGVGQIQYMPSNFPPQPPKPSTPKPPILPPTHPVNMVY